MTDPMALSQNTKLLVNMANNFGLGVVLAILIVIILVGVLFWVMKTTESRETRYHNQNDKLVGIIDQSIQSMTEASSKNTSAVAHVTELLKSINEDVKNRYESIKQANQFQREEHRDMIQMMASIQQEVSRNQK